MSIMKSLSLAVEQGKKEKLVKDMSDTLALLEYTLKKEEPDYGIIVVGSQLFVLSEETNIETLFKLIVKSKNKEFSLFTFKGPRFTISTFRDFKEVNCFEDHIRLDKV